MRVLKRTGEHRSRRRAGSVLPFVVAAVILAAAVSACRPAKLAPYERAPLSAESPGAHALYSERLRAVMEELGLLARGQLPQEIDAVAAESRRMAEIARLADDLAAAADRIPDVLADVELDDQRRSVFVQFVADLRAESRDLAILAREDSTAGVENAYGYLLETCEACHNTFRILPAVMAP